MSVSIDGPSFVALQVRDTEAAARFFEVHLGLVRSPAGPPHAIVFDTKPIAIAMREPLPGTDLDAGRPGLGVALWFSTPDAEALHDQLVAGGVEIAAPLGDSPFGRVFSFVGPEGYVLTAHGG